MLKFSSRELKDSSRELKFSSRDIPRFLQVSYIRVRGLPLHGRHSAGERARAVPRGPPDLVSRPAIRRHGNLAGCIRIVALCEGIRHSASSEAFGPNRTRIDGSSVPRGPPDLILRPGAGPDGNHRICGGRKSPLLSQNPLEKVGGFAPHLSQWVVR